MLYVDSADRRRVEPLLATGLFDGITTNPALLVQAGLGSDDLPDVLVWARDAGARIVFMQTTGATVVEHVERGLALRGLGDDVVVKVPATRLGLEATHRLTSRGIPVLLTAAYDASQALLADAAGASYIAPYVGRMSDQGRDGVAQTIEMRRILADGRCRVLAASLRSRTIVASLAAAGIQDFAIPVALCDEMVDDELTDAAATEFEALASQRTEQSGVDGSAARQPPRR